MRIALSLMIAAIAEVLGIVPANADPAALVVAAFSVDLSDAPGAGTDKLAVFARRLRTHPETDLWGLTGLPDEASMPALLDHADGGAGGARSYAGHVGRAGGSRRVAIIYDTRRLERLAGFELVSTVRERCRQRRIDGFRAPVVGIFRDRRNGGTLLFMVNDLDADSAGLRLCQAEALNDWAATSKNRHHPRIAVGRYDFGLRAGSVGPAVMPPDLDAMLRNDGWSWVRPEPLQWTRCPEAEGSVPDLVFAGSAAASWPASVKALGNGSGDYCSPERQLSESRHRPVRAVFQLR